MNFIADKIEKNTKPNILKFIFDVFKNLKWVRIPMEITTLVR